MAIAADWIWMDGKLVPFADANVHVLSHTLHYGVGAFEGIRAYEQPDGQAGIWCLDEHIERLLLSIKMIRYKSPFSAEDIKEACLATLEANGHTNAYLRPLAFLGHGTLGLGVRSNPMHVVVATWPWGSYLGDDGVKNGIRVCTSSFTRNHPNSLLQRAKVVGHYVNSVLARYEANDDGYDEALMLDHNGLVAEGTGENVFVCKGDVVMTPPVLNVLPGITRTCVVEILTHVGLVAKEVSFGRDAFYVADEAFFCGTAAEITPIRELDRREVGDGTPGAITKMVQSTYNDGVRGRVDWLRHHITTRT